MVSATSRQLNKFFNRTTKNEEARGEVSMWNPKFSKLSWRCASNFFIRYWCFYSLCHEISLLLFIHLTDRSPTLLYLSVTKGETWVGKLFHLAEWRHVENCNRTWQSLSPFLNHHHRRRRLAEQHCIAAALPLTCLRGLPAYLQPASLQPACSSHIETSHSQLCVGKPYQPAYKTCHPTSEQTREDCPSATEHLKAR